MDGVSLVPLMTGRVKHLDLDAYRNRRTTQVRLERAVRAARRAIQVHRCTPAQLYDLDVDPGEQHNIFNRRTALGSAMAARVDALAKSPLVRDPMDTAVDGETAARLTALGYVGRGAAGVPRGGPVTFAIDPRTASAATTRASAGEAASPHSCQTLIRTGQVRIGALAFLRTTKDTGSASSNAPR